MVFHIHNMVDWKRKIKTNPKKNYYSKPFFQVLIKIDKILYGDIARCSLRRYAYIFKTNKTIANKNLLIAANSSKSIYFFSTKQKTQKLL